MKKFFVTIFIFFTILINIFPQQPYVILVSFDAFRWDYPDRGISPAIEKMRQEGVSALSFQPCFPSKTFPNHLSIITGMYPENHGIILNTFINPFTKELYRLGDRSQVVNPEWYLGEPFWETARRNGIISASYFWPGSEIDNEQERPNYYLPFNDSTPNMERIASVIDWLKLPYEERPHFITLYFDDTDDKGHEYGPNSPEINDAIKTLDGNLDSLYKGITALGLKDSINVILISDHGMTEVSLDRLINLETILSGLDFSAYDNGPVVMIFPDESSTSEIYDRLKQNENHYKVYLKDNIPDYYHFSKHPFIAPIILIADLGWTIVDNLNFMKEHFYSAKGNHGYPVDEIDMHGIFIAEGPAFRKGLKTGTLWNIDIYPLLCKIFGIEPRSNIDGNLERIEFILNTP
ncbi:MAG: ectonucleotide pyrophosphatase/phosphodiesterase [bacterium]